MPHMASRADPWARPSPPVGPEAFGIAAAAASTVAFAMTVLGATSEPPISLIWRNLPVWLIALGLLAGLAVIGATWIVCIERPALAIALAVTTTGLLVPMWAGVIVLPPAAQAGALAAAPLAMAGVSHVGVRWSRAVAPTGRVRVIYALAIAAVVVLAAGYNPLTDPGCNLTCASVQPPLASLLSSRVAYALATTLVGAAGVLAMVELVREAAHGRSGWVSWASLLAVLVLAASWVDHAVSWTVSRTMEAVVLPAVVTGLLAGLAPILATAAIRRRRLAMRELVDHLSDTGLTTAAASGLNLRVQYADPDDARWVGADGEEVESGAVPARAVVISDAGGPALRLEVPVGEDPGELLATLTPATMLALQNARLAAVGRARLAEVRASQRRIVDASDAERQRIERDLHDGAQQRLVGAMFQLSLARSRLASGHESLARAEASVGDALSGLRQLGHGVFPTTLAPEGLAGALEDLARGSDVPITLDVPELDLERDVALAAYALVSTVLALARHAPGLPSANLVATVNERYLELRLLLIGRAQLDQTDLVDVADRVGAIGGHLVVEPIEDGVAITAVMPCAS